MLVVLFRENGSGCLSAERTRNNPPAHQRCDLRFLFHKDHSFACRRYSPNELAIAVQRHDGSSGDSVIFIEEDYADVRRI